MPFAALETFPLNLIGTPHGVALLSRLVPAPSWPSPPMGCFGQPVGTVGENTLEYAARGFEGLVLFCGVLGVLLALGTIVAAVRLRRGRWGDAMLVSVTAWTTIASVLGFAEFFVRFLMM